MQIYKKYRFEQNKRTLFCSKWGKNIVSSKIKSGYSAQNTSKDPFRAKQRYIRRDGKGILNARTIMGDFLIILHITLGKHIVGQGFQF